MKKKYLKIIILGTIVFLKYNENIHADCKDLTPNWTYNNGYPLDIDADNDGLWDVDKGGLDRDLDNDGLWDYKFGGIDRDADNDGLWDY